MESDNKVHPLQRREFLHLASGLLLVSGSSALIGCGGGSGGGGGGTTVSDQPSFIPSVGSLPAVTNQTASIGTAGGRVELAGVASVIVPASTLTGSANVRLQATADPDLAALFQITGSAAQPSHRASYEVRINLESQVPQRAGLTVALQIPDALLALGAGGVTAFVRQVDTDPDDGTDFFSPVAADVNLSAKAATITLGGGDFTVVADGSYEAQVVLALTPGGRHVSRVPGSRDPITTYPDFSPNFSVENLPGAAFASPPLKGVALVVVSRIGLREATNTPHVAPPPGGPKPHRGIDLRAADGTPVLAVADGYVEQVTRIDQFPGGTSPNGNYIRVRHDDGTATEYLHLSAFDEPFRSLAKRATYPGPIGAGRVKAGDQIGLSGHSSSGAIDPHLHLQYRTSSGGYANPETFLLPGSLQPDNYSLPALVSEFLFTVNGHVYESDRTILTSEIDQTLTLTLTARDSVFREVRLPPDGELIVTVTPSSVATAPLHPSAGVITLTRKAAGIAQVKVEYSNSVQRPRKAYGSVNVTPGALAPTPVTVAQYRAYCDATGREMIPLPKLPAPGWAWMDDHPIIDVTWYEAAAYCTWAGGRLPTVAEFEFGQTDGGKNIVYPWGDTFDDNSLWCSVVTQRPYTAPVHRSNNIYVNSLGLSDMAGNVFQWCSDGVGGNRFIKGGGWYNGLNMDWFRCAYHITVTLPQYKFIEMGFRLFSSGS